MQKESTPSTWLCLQHLELLTLPLQLLTLPLQHLEQKKETLTLMLLHQTLPLLTLPLQHLEPLLEEQLCPCLTEVPGWESHPMGRTLPMKQHCGQMQRIHLNTFTTNTSVLHNAPTHVASKTKLNATLKTTPQTTLNDKHDNETKCAQTCNSQKTKLNWLKQHWT